MFDRHLARVADVDRLVEIGLREAKDAVDQVGDVTEGTGLRAVAEDGEGSSSEGLADESRHDASVAQAHTRAVGVEDADDRVDPMIAVVGHRDRLGERFASS